MEERISFEKSAPIDEIRHKLRLLNTLNSFVVFVLASIIVIYMFEPIKSHLTFLPDVSLTAIAVIAMALSVAASYLSRMIARRVIGSIRKYGQELDGILNITKEIKEEIYGDLLLEKIMDCSLAMTRSEAGYILLRDGDGLLFKTTRGERMEGLAGKSVPGDIGMAGTVLKHGTPVFVNDAASVTEAAASYAGLAGYRPQRAICVPLRTETGLMGVIELLDKQEGDYDSMDVGLLSYLSDQAAISMERAAFYENQRNYEIQITDVMTAAIDNLVPGKQGHSRRVARYVNMLTKAMEMPDERRRRMYLAALLHDIGYLRSSRDSDRTHPRTGYEMLGAINFYGDIAPYVLHHHERYDGLGFPDGKRGEGIPIESRVLAVADAFDKIAGESPASGDYAASVEELKRASGAELDPRLVELFVGEVEGALKFMP